MGKRSDFKRVEKDYYPTPLKAVEPLVPFIQNYLTFTEPCAGDYRLVDHVTNLVPTLWKREALDIEPKDKRVSQGNALTHDYEPVDVIITNPPWDRKLLHPMIDKFRSIAPTWLLFDADWMHTQQSAPYMQYCKSIVSIGRVKWIEDSTMTGKDNCVWYEFVSYKTPTTFYGRELTDKQLKLDI